MSALMNECAHGSDGSYHVSDDSPHDYVCPYCEIERLTQLLQLAIAGQYTVTIDEEIEDLNEVEDVYAEREALRAALEHVLPWVQKEHLAVMCWQCERARETLRGKK